MKNKSLKIFSVCLITILVICGAYVPYFPAVQAANTDSVKLNFSDYASDVEKALESAFDYSGYGDPDSVFYMGLTYNKSDYLLSLSQSAVEKLSRTEDTDNPYYITYNCKAGSAFTLTSLRKNGFWQYSKGYSFKFRFYSSVNNIDFNEIVPSITTQNVNYVSQDGNPYDLLDTYVMNIPADAIYLKIEFPNRRSLLPEFFWTSGYEVFGTVKDITYVPFKSDYGTEVTKSFAGFDQNTAAALSDAYDATLFTKNNDGSVSDNLNFSTGVYYGNYNFMLTLSKGLLDSMSPTSSRVYTAQDPGYYVAYNVVGGTTLTMTSYRMGEFSRQATAAGYDISFRFYVSPDYKTWEQVTSTIKTNDVNYASADSYNPYNKEDIYSVKLPNHAKFIRICFPQVRNMINVHWYTNGYNSYGTIASIKYTKPNNEAAPLESRQMPQYLYKKSIDFYNTAQTVNNVLKIDTLGFTQNAFGLNNENARYIDEQGNTRKLLSLRSDYISGKSEISPQCYITYKVQPQSAFKLESMHLESAAVKLNACNYTYRFKFFVSSDGVKWESVNPSYYNEEGTKYKRPQGWGHYSSLDTYIVNIPKTARLITIVFPQTKDYSMGDAPILGNNTTTDKGDWQIAAVRSIEYTPYCFDVNNDGKTDIRDIVNIKKALCYEKGKMSHDLNVDNLVDGIDLALLKRELLTFDGEFLSDWNEHFNSFDILTPVHGEMTATTTPTITWEALNGVSYYSLKVDEFTNNKYVNIIDIPALNATSYKITKPLKCGTAYRITLYGVMPNGVKKPANNIPDGGYHFMSIVDSANNPVNKGINYEFKNGITEEVLRNYMSRMLICGLFDWHVRESGRCETNEADDIRMILNTGAKIVSRAYCQWLPSSDEDAHFAHMKEVIDGVHGIDPDIVFEACIFETTCAGMNTIKIPSWVFEAFGLPVENRNFRQDLMDFTDGTYVNIWGSGVNCPDISRLETQMFVYYRARTFIDLGFEALHFGQVDLIECQDQNHEGYTSVFKMIRDYAKEHSRRGYILLNAHHRIGYKFTDPTGKYLLEDYTGFPVRMLSASNDTEHIPTPDNPQKTYINSGDPNSLINMSVGGITPYGVKTEHQLFKLELDNYMSGDLSNLNKPYIVNWPWGMDEISWFANQPDDYRHEWLEYAYNRIHSLDSNGYFEMPGKRIVVLLREDNPYDVDSKMYYANSKKFSDVGFDDEEFIKEVWSKSNID